MHKYAFLFLFLFGCAPASISTAAWNSGNGPRVLTRCERVDMRDQKEMSAVFAKYDGWKLIYISEYTTGNRFGTDAAVCFEKSE